MAEAIIVLYAGDDGHHLLIVMLFVSLPKEVKSKI